MHNPELAIDRMKEPYTTKHVHIYNLI